MSKNSIEAYNACGKRNLLMFEPEALTLVIDDKHPLYDARVHDALTEPFVNNIMAHGVIEPVVITKNTETGDIEVVAGRQRVKAAIEANKRLKAQGLPPIQVPAVPRKGDEASLMAVMVSENEARREDTPLNRAAKMQRLRDLGRTDDQLATIFACSKQTVRSLLALLDCTAAVRSAVDAGKIGLANAYALAKLEPDEQRSKLAEIVEAGAAPEPKERVRKVKAIARGKVQMRSKTTIKAVIDKRTARHGTSDQVLNVLLWVMGEDVNGVDL